MVLVLPIWRNGVSRKDFNVMKNCSGIPIRMRFAKMVLWLLLENVNVWTIQIMKKVAVIGRRIVNMPSTLRVVLFLNSVSVMELWKFVLRFLQPEELGLLFGQLALVMIAGVGNGRSEVLP